MPSGAVFTRTDPITGEKFEVDRMGGSDAAGQEAEAQEAQSRAQQLRKQAEAAKARSEQRADRLDLKSKGEVVRRIGVSPTSNSETQLVEYEDGSTFLKMSFTYMGDRQQRFVKVLVPVVWMREQ